MAEAKSILDHALDYAELEGWAVLPFHSIADGKCTCDGHPNCKPGKHPRTGRGVKASTNMDQIRQWWTLWPDANIGIEMRGMALFDVDAGSVGPETFDGLLAQHHLDAGPCVLTGGGGMHWYFRAHTGVKTGNGRFGLGIDCKTGPNTFAIAPPSIHLSGERYRWLPGYDFTAPLPTFPESLIAKLNPPRRRPVVVPAMNSRQCSRYGEVALANLVVEIEAAPHGDPRTVRHRTLVRTSIRAGELARDRHVHPVEAFRALVAAGIRAYAGSRSDDEIGRTVEECMIRVVA